VIPNNNSGTKKKHEELICPNNDNHHQHPIVAESKQPENNSSESSSCQDETNEDMMHHHHPHQRFYQYGGPPSIVMGTWGDRKSSRSTFAPPPPPFAIPPAGVPGGRMGPGPMGPVHHNRMTAGYHSLQYVPVKANELKGLGHGGTHSAGLEKKGSVQSSSKYSRDGSDQQLHKLPQVKAFVSQVEQHTNKQLKSKPLWMSEASSVKNSPKIEVRHSNGSSKKSPDFSSKKSTDFSSKKSSTSSSNSSFSTTKSSSETPSISVSVTQQEKVNNNEKMMDNPKNAVVAASRKPSAASMASSVASDADFKKPQKPQFFFGQTMTDVVKKSSVSNGYQTAIDKVKQNEALTHPKRNEEQQKVSSVTELNKKGRHMSIITVAEDKSKDKGGSSLSSGVSSLSSSSNSSTRSSPAKESISSHKILNSDKVKPVEPTQDTIRKAFEAQLIAGKSKLKKVEDEVGQVAKPPPTPIPPPPPPPILPNEGPIRSNEGPLRSYEIPQAPKMKKTAPNIANKKGLVAPNGLSAREELMNAIRGTGGFQGLRKINSGKNL